MEKIGGKLGKGFKVERGLMRGVEGSDLGMEKSALARLIYREVRELGRLKEKPAPARLIICA